MLALPNISNRPYSLLQRGHRRPTGTDRQFFLPLVKRVRMTRQRGHMSPWGWTQADACAFVPPAAVVTESAPWETSASGASKTLWVSGGGCSGWGEMACRAEGAVVVVKAGQVLRPLSSSLVVVPAHARRGRPC